MSAKNVSLSDNEVVKIDLKRREYDGKWLVYEAVPSHVLIGGEERVEFDEKWPADVGYFPAHYCQPLWVIAAVCENKSAATSYCRKRFNRNCFHDDNPNVSIAFIT